MSALPCVATLPYREGGSQPRSGTAVISGLYNIEHLGWQVAPQPSHHHKKPSPKSLYELKCVRLLAFTAEGQVAPLPCGQWSCPHCAKELARLWAWRARLHLEAHSDAPAFFWTFTLRPSIKTPEAGYAALPRLWDNLRQDVRRATGHWSYLAFVEGHPQRSWIPHFHAISMSKAPVRIKDLAMYAGFGWRATESLINSGKAAAYVAKYASKVNPATPKGFRRVRCSQDWAKLPDFTGDPLIVKSRNETTTHYLLRVNEVSGVPIDDLREEWDAMHELYKSLHAA